MVKSLSVVSLFSGVGGFDLGFVQAGFNILCATDIDRIATSTYRLNFPGHKVLTADIRDLAGEHLTDKHVDVLIGGAPCQGFSLAGTRNPNDPRNSLPFEFVRMVDELRPNYFVFENVPNLLVQEAYRPILDSILSAIADIGRYHFIYRVLDFWKYGVPQTRRRLIILGSKADLYLPLLDHPPESHQQPITAREALHGLTDIGQVTKHDLATLKLFKKMTPGGRCSEVSRLQKIDLDRPSPTVLTKQRLIHPDRNTYLTYREAARLQTFPDDFVFYPSTETAYKQLGNAVPPVFSRAIADHIKFSVTSSY